jgi:hypothetical protein
LGDSCVGNNKRCLITAAAGPVIESMPTSRLFDCRAPKPRICLRGAQTAAFGCYAERFLLRETTMHSNRFAAGCRELQAGSLRSPELPLPFEIVPYFL